MKMTKKIYHVSIEDDEESYSTGFFADDGSIITIIHENDASWRNEYFKPIMTHLGAEVVNLDEISYKDIQNAANTCGEMLDNSKYRQFLIVEAKKKIVKLVLDANIQNNITDTSAVLSACIDYYKKDAKCSICGVICKPTNCKRGCVFCDVCFSR